MAKKRVCGDTRMNKQDKKEIMNLIKYKKMLGEQSMSTYDITYCVRPCSNMQCERNIKHLDGLDIRLPISQASFDNCEEWMVEMTGKNLFDGKEIINIQCEPCKHE